MLLLFNFQWSTRLSSSPWTAYILYHISSRLSSTFSKVFLIFSKFFRISFSSKLFVWFRHPFSRRPYIIPQTVRFVKGFFKSFLRFFKVFSWRISPSTQVNFSILFKVLKDLLKAEMLHSSVVFPVLHFETFLIQPKLTGHFSLPLGVAIYWIYLHFLCFPSGQLIYYTTNPLFCQGVFRKFFRFFVIFLRFSASYKAFRNFLSFFVHSVHK